MKTRPLTHSLLLAISFFLIQCKSAPEPQPTLDERATALITVLRPRVTGTWQISTAQIKRRELGYFQVDPGITQDTVLRNLATLTLSPASVNNKRLPKEYGPVLELEGTVAYGGKTYPIYGLLDVGPTRIAGQSGLQGFVLLQYNFTSANFPPGSTSRRVEVEEDYLHGVGLIGDNFSVEVAENQRTMTWRGLNRAISSAVLQKR